MPVTFVLGALAARGAAVQARAAAVVVAVRLDLKPTLRHWRPLMQHCELTAALPSLLLSRVIAGRTGFAAGDRWRFR